MSHELALEFLPSINLGQLCCPLCATLFEPWSTVALLDDGDVPMGYLCERCFMTGPHAAAQTMRERTLDLRGFVLRARTNLTQPAWLKLLLAMQERIDHWDLLADRVDQLSWWQLKGSDSDHGSAA